MVEGKVNGWCSVEDSREVYVIFISGLDKCQYGLRGNLHVTITPSRGCHGRSAWKMYHESSRTIRGNTKSVAREVAVDLSFQDLLMYAMYNPCESCSSLLEWLPVYTLSLVFA